MVDFYGNWTKEKDYSKFPKEKWCDMDYIAAYLDEIVYVPKNISYEELIENLIYTYQEDIELHNLECGENLNYYAIKDTREYPDNLMINMPDFQAWLDDVGEISDFDYEV